MIQNIILNKEIVYKKLDTDIKFIFNGIDIDKLSDYEKRKIIFDYLTNIIQYDYQELDIIKKINNSVKFDGKNIGPKRMKPWDELKKVMFENEGVCNAIAQYYSLLLERVGIKSYCVITNDGTDVLHQLNLVYNAETDSYSFDDITSVIVGRGNTDDFFDYDIEKANSMNQGNTMFYNEFWSILSWEFIDFYIKRNVERKRENIEFNEISDKIKRVKNINSKR